MLSKFESLVENFLKFANSFLKAKPAKISESYQGRRAVLQPITTPDQHPSGPGSSGSPTSQQRPEPLPFFAPNDQALSLEGLRNADPKLRSTLLGDTWDPTSVKARRIVIFLLSVRNGKNDT